MLPGSSIMARVVAVTGVVKEVADLLVIAAVKCDYWGWLLLRGRWWLQLRR
jgi:hypothetical protein